MFPTFFRDVSESEKIRNFLDEVFSMSISHWYMAIISVVLILKNASSNKEDIDVSMRNAAAA